MVVEVRAQTPVRSEISGAGCTLQGQNPGAWAGETAGREP